jgi:hypothetical protein
MKNGIMIEKLRPILFAGFLIAVASMAYGLNYMYYTDEEITRLGDRVKFWHGDTLCGPIRSNGEIALMQDPVLCDFVISSAADFWRGGSFNPDPMGDYITVFDAPRLEMPTRANQIRALATEQEYFFAGGDSLDARVEVLTDRLRIWWSPRGMPFDTMTFAERMLPDSAVVFFDCSELHLFGTIGTKLIVGASGTVLLEDNLIYASANNRGIAPAGHPEKLAVVAERDIKIQNTFANGRQNSSITDGSGTSQTNQNLTSIALDGVYVALGESFTFEQQNDADSGYVCLPCGCLPPPGNGGGPDDRGYVHLFGCIMQSRRGYVHRSTCSSSGYLKNYHYDSDLKFWNVPIFDAAENEASSAEIDFGSIEPGHTARDTLRFRNDFVPIKIDSLQVMYPFILIAPPDSYHWTHTIPLTFAPPNAGTYIDTIRFYIGYYGQWFAVPIRGVATTSSGASDVGAPAPVRFDLQAYPNPFNPSTEIDFSLPVAGQVVITVFDILGQRVAVLNDGVLSAGEHRVSFNGQRYPSGLYFLRLETASQQRTLKLVLMK